MNKNSKIFVAGHKGLVGSAIVRNLNTQGYKNIITRNRQELDLLNQDQVCSFFQKQKPQYVFDAAAKVGGIMGNSKYAADFLYQNLQIQNNLIFYAHQNKVKKLLFLGSSCIYPKFAKQPIKEEYLLTGALEYTNEAYAVAKIAGLMMTKKYNEQYGDNFISAMPTNLYGVNDNFHPENSHVIPALIQRIHDAKVNNKKSVTIWGSGEPLREFLYVDDLAEGLVFLMNNYNGKTHINIGTGQDVSIRELAETIVDVVKFSGELEFDTTKPDGTPRKLLDVSQINDLGWKASTSLKYGLEQTYNWFLENINSLRSN